MVLVPVTNLFVAGFSCTSRSKRNNSRAKFSHCIALGTECETSGTFDDNLEYIKSCKPKVVILENVPELMKELSPGVSDLNTILDALRCLGYWTKYFVIDAFAYGSVAKRTRLFILGVQLHQSLIHEGMLRTVADFCDHVVNGLRTTSGHVSEYVDLPNRASIRSSNTSLAHLQMQGATDEPALKSNKSFRDGYKDEHFEIFSYCGHAWPPRYSDLDVEIDKTDLNDRQAQLSYLLLKQFREEMRQCTVPMFVDANCTLGHLVNWPSETCKNPWTTYMPTFTSTAHIVCYFNSACRKLRGHEYMRIIGWSDEMWADSGESKTQRLSRDLCVSLAGNAFSSFAVYPVLMVGIALMGANSSSFKRSVQSVNDSAVGPTENDTSESEKSSDSD